MHAATVVTQLHDVITPLLLQLVEMQPRGVHVYLNAPRHDSPQPSQHVTLSIGGADGVIGQMTDDDAMMSADDDDARDSPPSLPSDGVEVFSHDLAADAHYSTAVS